MDTGGGGGRVGLTACSSKASEGVSNQFPAGLRVLVVDDDPTCLKILERMLRNCLYEVTTCSRAIVALSMLREKRIMFDLVLSDVHMPDMDGFKLLECIGLEMDLPVIMMSVDDKKDVVMKGVTHGACDYLIKPIRIEEIKNIWQHVVRKRRHELKELEQSESIEDSDRNRKPSEDADYASSANEGSWKNSKRRKEEEDEIDERDDTSSLKKPRVVWSIELHQQFVAAVNSLGINKAVPKKILELMNVPGLTRENVASHLQKYRLYLRRLSGVSQNQGGLNTPFMVSQEANFGPMSSLDGFDLQALAASAQLPPHSLATLQAGGLVARSTAKGGIGMPVMVDSNHFNPDMPPVRLGVGQELNGSSTQVNVYHGHPTNMEPKQLPLVHQPIQLSGSTGLQISEAASGFINLSVTCRGTSSMSQLDSLHGTQSNTVKIQMPHSKSRGQLLNGSPGDYPSGVPLSLGQQLISNDMASRVVGTNSSVLKGRGAAHDSRLQASSSFDFQMNNNTELPGNGFPLGVTAAIPGLQSIGMSQNRRNMDVKGLRGITTNYSICNGFQQCKTQDWEVHNENVTLEHAKSIEGNPDFSQATFPLQSFASSHNSGQNHSTSMPSSGKFTIGESQYGILPSFQQQYNNLPVDNLFRIKTESVNDFSSDNMFLARHLCQEDLMSAILKQQEAVGVVENESNFDGYPIDDIQT